MKATFVVLFDQSLPRWPDTNGTDQIMAASRVGQVPGPVPTNIVLIEAPAAVIVAIEADPNYLLVEEVP